MDLQQIFEVRRVMEGYAAALAADRATQADIAALEATLIELARLDRHAPPQAYMEIDRAFHRGIARAAHNKYLESSLSRLYNLNLRLWYLDLEKIGPMSAAIAQHRQVLQAVVARDADRAAAAMREHISDFQTRIKDTL
jgi:DNA-binding GntR family transcriptional regulator